MESQHLWTRQAGPWQARSWTSTCGLFSASTSITSWAAYHATLLELASHHWWPSWVSPRKKSKPWGDGAHKRTQPMSSCRERSVWKWREESAGWDCESPRVMFGTFVLIILIYNNKCLCKCNGNGDANQPIPFQVIILIIFDWLDRQNTTFIKNLIYI